MATTPGSRRRDTRTDITGDDRDTLTPMQEPLGSIDTPGSRTSDYNEVNLPPGETVRRTGNLGTTNSPRAATSERAGRSFTSTFAIAVIVLVAAFLIALYMVNTGSQSPISDTTNSGTNSTDTTGSTTTPSQQTAPGTGDASNTTGGNAGTTTPPANP
jgi:hypothetical protein